jgi:hypothetical protein|tara:strand:- start:550 stop:783 length:234 start_codon:yes stop_codon:yes gene_type:complete
MLDLVSRLQELLWETAKFLGLVVAVAILISMLFGTGVPFFGGILDNTQNVIALLGSEGLGLIIAIIIILSVWNSRSS